MSTNIPLVVLFCLIPLLNSRSFLSELTIEEDESVSLTSYHRHLTPNMIGRNFYRSDGTTVPYANIATAEVIAIYVCDHGLPQCDAFTQTLVDTYEEVNADGKRLAVIQVPFTGPPEPVLEPIILGGGDSDADEVLSTFLDEMPSLQQLFGLSESDDLDQLDQDSVTETIYVPWLSYGNNTHQIESLKSQYQVYKQPSLYIVGSDGSLVATNGYQNVRQYGGMRAFLEFKKRVRLTHKDYCSWVNNSGDDRCSDSWVGNGVCDPACAVQAHKDAQDCSFLRKGCALSMLGDGLCDYVCSQYATHQDYYDCYA